MMTLHFIVIGKVQGVFFRAATIEFCTRNLITGWVRNLESGEVEVLATGNQTQLEQLGIWLHRGPEAAQVTKVLKESWEFQEFQHFTKLPTALVPLSMETIEHQNQSNPKTTP